jgi:hypothetical protein
MPRVLDTKTECELRGAATGVRSAELSNAERANLIVGNDWSLALH